VSTLKYGYKEGAYPELITRIDTGFCFMIVRNSWHVMKVMQNDISIVNLIFVLLKNSESNFFAKVLTNKYGHQPRNHL